MSIRGYSRFEEKVISHRKRQSQFVVVGAGCIAKRISRLTIYGYSVSRVRYIAEHLVVSRVLFVDENHVFDLCAAFARSSRNRTVRIQRSGVRNKSVILQHPIGVVRE